MECNVGGLDRALRFGFGAGALTAALFGKMSRGKRIAALALAGSGLFTATTQYCPASQLFGLNTCKEQKRFPRKRSTAPDQELLGTGI